MKKYKPTTKTLQNVLNYFDKNLQLPLSLDDQLYAKWRIERELFQRQLEKQREYLFEEWSRKYLVRFHDGFYEKGELIEKK